MATKSKVVDLDEKVRFTLPVIVVKALDAFYRKRYPRGGRSARPIRRARGPAVCERHEMITTRWTLGVIEQQALPDEVLEQTIYRLLTTPKKGVKPC